MRKQWIILYGTDGDVIKQIEHQVGRDCNFVFLECPIDKKIAMIRIQNTPLMFRPTVSPVNETM